MTCSETEPAAPNLDWEDVAELSIHCETGLVVAPPMDAPVLTIVRGGGDYRLRVSARGRDNGAVQEHGTDEDGEPLEQPDVVEHYLIEAWPQPPRDPVLHRLSSQVAVEASQGETPEPPAPGQTYGLAGGRAVGAALDSGLFQDWTGDVGTVEVTHSLPGTPRRLFPIMTRTCGTFGDYSYTGSTELEPGSHHWT